MSLYWGRLGEESLLYSFDYQEISNAAYAVSSYVGVDWQKRHRSKAFIMYHQEIVDAVSSGCWGRLRQKLFCSFHHHQETADTVSSCYAGVDWDGSCSVAFIAVRKLLTLC